MQDPLYPNEPATAEIPSLKGFEVSAWAGIFAPQGVLAAVRYQITADITERNRTLGYGVSKLSTQAFTDLIARETGERRGIIKAVGFKLN